VLPGGRQAQRDAQASAGEHHPAAGLSALNTDRHHDRTARSEGIHTGL
jgi:hypothetical protein